MDCRLKTLMLKCGILVDRMAGSDESARKTQVGRGICSLLARSLFLGSCCIYSQEVGDPIAKGVRIPIRLNCVHLLCLLNGHMIPGIRILRITVLPFDGVDPNEAELMLDIFEKFENDNCLKDRSDRFIIHGRLRRVIKRASNLGMEYIGNQDS